MTECRAGVSLFPYPKGIVSYEAQGDCFPGEEGVLSKSGGGLGCIEIFWLFEQGCHFEGVVGVRAHASQLLLFV